MSVDTLLNLFGKTLPLFVALFAIPIVIKEIGDVRFGLLSMVWVIIGTSMLFDLGMGRATIKFVSDAFGRKAETEIPYIISCAVTTQLILGAMACLTVLLLTPFLVSRVFEIPTHLNDEAKHIFFLSGFAIPITFVIGSYRGLLEAARRFDIVNLIAMLFSSLNYLAPVLGIWLGWGLKGIVALLLTFRFLQLITYYGANRILHPHTTRFHFFSWKQFKRLFAFSGWVALSGAIGRLQENTEKLFIAGMLPISTLTYYTVPKEMLDRVYIFPASLSSAIFPVVSRASVTDEEQLPKLFISSFKVILYVVGIFLFFITIHAKPLVSIWISEEFAAKSVSVIRILMIGVLASSLNNLSFEFLQGIGRPDITVKLQCIRFPIVCIIGFLLISHFGIFGAAVAWTFGRAFAMVTNVGVFAKMGYLKTSATSPFLATATVGSIFGFSASFWFAGVWSDNFSISMQLLLSTSGSLLLLTAIWFVLLDNNERNWIQSNIQRFRKSK